MGKTQLQLYKFKPEDVINDGKTSQKNINSIKVWLAERPEIPNIPDQMIVLFLLSCNNNIDATRKTIEAYFELKKNSPELFDDRNMEREDLKLALNTVYFSSLPKRTKDNYAIHCFKLKDFNYVNTELIPIMKLAYMLLDVTQESNPPSGLTVVVDLEGVTLLHMTRIKLAATRKFFKFLQEGLPIELKEIHIINTVYFFDKILTILKTLAKSEIFNLMKIHPADMDMKEFFEKYIPAECMPKDYGGDQPSFDELQERTIQQLKDRQEFFDYEEDMRKVIIK